MNPKHCGAVAAALSLRPGQVSAVASLLEGGATVPFIARYRKETTGELDEVAIAAVRDALDRLRELDDRRAAVLASLEERGLLTDELRAQVEACETLARLEDVYLPYRPKRRTRAQVARERGLAPLAADLLAQESPLSPEELAAPYVDEAKEIPDAEAALSGARDIVAEQVAEDADLRAELRALFDEAGSAVSKVVPGKEEEGAKFSDYFDAAEPLSGIPSHRLLALLRGEKEGFLSLSVRPPKEDAQALVRDRYVAGEGPLSDQVAQACDSAYSRLLAPAMEVEARLRAFTRASDEAIRVFAANLRELLMAAPLGRKAVLAIDPGIRTGCKVVALDAQGKLLEDCVVQLARSGAERRDAADAILDLVRRHGVLAVAVGNGTYGREAEAFVRSIGLPPEVAVVSVSESGASIYSASDLARAEFPDKDVTVRGAVSIGRRLMDPLAELVKLDPKTIGVGQYQHDVDQTRLRQALDDTVLSCVNAVGVEVNTASPQLLARVSGLGPSLAENIVRYRDEHGPFATREALKEVPRMGPKAFEQSAGFLRIAGGENPLDASAVHPERYDLVARMASDLGRTVPQLLAEPALAKRLDLARYASDDVGLPTLRDIVAELAKPGRDPRKAFEAFSFAEGVHEIGDLAPGMKLPGVVTNVTAFGAFVDVGVHQDGLVHVSQLADRFVKDPNEIVKVGDRVKVTVVSVDLARNRIGLSMRSNPTPSSGRDRGAPAPRRDRPPRHGDAPRRDRGSFGSLSDFLSSLP
jgi:uncharacterized protein